MSSPSWRVRLKDYNNRTCVLSIAPDLTLGSFQLLIAENLKIAINQIEINVGFPPKPIQGLKSDQVQSLGIKNNDVILIKKKGIVHEMKEGKSIGKFIPSINMQDSVQVYQVPRDNSCLFHCVNLICQPPNETTQSLRVIVSEIISKNPQTYTTAVLGQSNAIYCQSILDPTCWGGFIEIKIFSELYKTQFVCYDIGGGSELLFGSLSYTSRGYVIWDGEHYNLIENVSRGSSGFSSSCNHKLFGSQDTIALDKCRKLAQSLAPLTITFCGDLKTNKPQHPTIPHPSQSTTKICCSKCTYLNDRNNTKCELCQNPLKESYSLKDNMQNLNLGKTCPICTFSNPSSNTKCEMCQSKL